MEQVIQNPLVTAVLTYIDEDGEPVAISVTNPIPSASTTNTDIESLLQQIADNTSDGGVLLTYSTPLNAGQTYTSSVYDVSDYSSVAFSLKMSTVGTLLVDYSIDGVNFDSTLTYTVAADTNEPHILKDTKQYVRFRITNTSVSNQTYLRFQVLVGEQQQLTSPANSVVQQDADAILTRPLDFNLLVAEGLYQNRSFTVKEGINFNLGTTGSLPKDITNEGTLYAGFPTSAAAAEIVVANAADVGTVYYSYMASSTDTDYTFGAAAVNGTGTVALGHNIWRCNYAYFVKSGSTTALNVGDITIRQSAPNTTVVFCVIPATLGQTFCAAYTVPFGSSVYLDRVQGNVKGSTSASVEGYFWYRPFGESPRMRFSFELQYGTLYFDDIDYSIKIPALTDIVPHVTVASANNLGVKFTYRLVKVVV